jgi:hypothetical protein
MYYHFPNFDPLLLVGLTSCPCGTRAYPHIYLPRFGTGPKLFFIQLLIDLEYRHMAPENSEARTLELHSMTNMCIITVQSVNSYKVT